MPRSLAPIARLLLSLALVSPDVAGLTPPSHPDGVFQATAGVYRTQAVSQPSVSPVHPIESAVKVEAGRLAMNLGRLGAVSAPYLPAVAASAGSVMATMTASTLHYVPLFLLGAVWPRSFSDSIWLSRMMNVVEHGRTPRAIARKLAVDFLDVPLTSASHLEVQQQNQAFLEALRKSKDGKLQAVYSAIQVDHLFFESLKHENMDADRRSTAIEVLKKRKAVGDLLQVVKFSPDMFAVAAAYDALESLGAERELELCREESPQNVLNAIHAPRYSKPMNRMLMPVAISVLERLGRQDLIEEVRNDAQFRSMLRLELTADGLDVDKQTIDTAIDLFAGKATYDEAEQFLMKVHDIAEWYEAPNGFLAATMLAITTVMADSPYFDLTIQTKADRIRDTRHLITRTWWGRPALNHGLVNLDSIAMQAGQALHRGISDPAVDEFLAILFQISFMSQSNWLDHMDQWVRSNLTSGVLTHALNDDEALETPSVAALAQLLAIVESAMHLGFNDHDMLWIMMYDDAIRLADKKKSLSEIGEFVWKHYFQVQFQSPSDARKRTVDRKEKRWRVFLPNTRYVPRIKPPTIPSLKPALAPANPTPDELRQIVLEYLYRMTNHGYLMGSDFIEFYLKRWNVFEAVLTGKEVEHFFHFFGVQLTKICQLGCLTCRGLLREVPEIESMIGTLEVLAAVRSIARYYPGSFIQLTGTIGDPGAHPGIDEIAEALADEPRLEAGIITNGITMNRPRFAQALMKFKNLNVSLDQPTAELYRIWKYPHLVGYDPKFFDRVMRNIELICRMRDEQKSSLDVTVSALPNNDNVHLYPELSLRLKEMGVRRFVLKMQHYDPRLSMSEDKVHLLYRDVMKELRSHEEPHYEVRFFQSEEKALSKIGKGDLVQIGAPQERVPFRKCYINTFGTAILAPADGNSLKARIERCCQGFDSILGDIGETVGSDLYEVLNSPRAILAQEEDPRKVCRQCSEMDGNINEFVGFAAWAAAIDPTIVSFIKNTFIRFANSRRRFKRGPSEPLPGEGALLPFPTARALAGQALDADPSPFLLWDLGANELRVADRPEALAQANTAIKGLRDAIHALGPSVPSLARHLAHTWGTTTIAFHTGHLPFPERVVLPKGTSAARMVVIELDSDLLASQSFLVQEALRKALLNLYVLSQDDLKTGASSPEAAAQHRQLEERTLPSWVITSPTLLKHGFATWKSLVWGFGAGARFYVSLIEAHPLFSPVMSVALLATIARDVVPAYLEWLSLTDRPSVPESRRLHQAA